MLDHIGVKVEEANIKVKQLPSKKPMKPYVVTIKEEQMRNLVLNRKIKGLLKSSAINLEGTEINIFINEDLPKLIQELFFKAKMLKQLGYRYIWTKEGKMP
ncbi:hypothetical protein HHI36_018958, partial [Cryptolaemus montrouzieri]